MTPVSTSTALSNNDEYRNPHTSSSSDVAKALEATTILITGAAGFVGVALVQRLLCDTNLSCIKRVICIIRGDSVESATARLPESLQQFTTKTSEEEVPRLVVLNGDCGKPDLGLPADQLRVALQADIVIHAAGDTRFTLPLKDAMGSISDLAYMTSRFSLLSYRVKTHIHISTTFVAWYLPDGSLIKEQLIQQRESNEATYEEHVNTYFHAKTLAEGCVNALFVPQNGRALHGKAARILRLSTVGPSLTFPRPAWGAGHPSSPLCAAIAAVELKDMSEFAEGAFLDVIPVDIAVNQIVALTAATHKTHSLSRDNIAHPRNSLNPVNQDGHNIPVYNIASGLMGSHNILLKTLNEPCLSLEEPYIPEKNLMKVYRPFVVKKLDFSTTQAAQVLQIACEHSQSPLDQSVRKLEKLGLSHTNGHVLDTSVNGNGKGTTRNLPEIWSDPSIDCGELQVDVAQAIALGRNVESDDAQLAWYPYIAMIRDEMERRGPRAEWTSFVD